MRVSPLVRGQVWTLQYTSYIQSMQEIFSIFSISFCYENWRWSRLSISTANTQPKLQKSVVLCGKQWCNLSSNYSHPEVHTPSSSPRYSSQGNHTCTLQETKLYPSNCFSKLQVHFRIPWLDHGILAQIELMLEGAHHPRSKHYQHFQKRRWMQVSVNQREISWYCEAIEKSSPITQWSKSIDHNMPCEVPQSQTWEDHTLFLQDAANDWKCRYQMHRLHNFTQCSEKNARVKKLHDL